MDDLLRAWNLEEYIQIFQDEEIDDKLMLLITMHDLEKLIPKVGPRARFCSRREQYRQSLRQEFAEPNNSKHLSKISHEHSSDNELLSDTVSNVSTSTTVSEVPSYNAEASDCDSSASTSNRLQSTGQKLRALIKKSPILKPLLKQTRLSTPDRKHLTDAIIDHLLQQNLTIKQKVFEFWADEIVAVFTREEKGIYYVPYISGSDGRLSGGKLWHRYCNINRYIKKKNLLCKEDTIAEEPLSEDILAEKNRYYMNLNTVSPDDEATVKKLWDHTYNFRMADKFNITEYYERFPILATPIGSSLLVQDFETSKICDASLLMKCWPEIAPEILRVVEERKVRLPFDVGSLLSETSALLALTHVLAPANVKTGNKKKWKPSAVEQGYGFILHINAMIDLEQELERIKKQLLLYGLTLQPLVVAVGPLTNFDAIYVIVNEVKYAASTLLSAVDMCFKIHYALSAKYNTQSIQLWTFIEKYVYQIKSNKNYNNVEILWSDIMSK